jgi:glycerol-3-phosphate acyltransferase PlsX
LKIMIDAMGGDNAPDEIVKGCIEAVNAKSGFDIELIGVESEIQRVLQKYSYPHDRVTIKPTSQIIYNEDKPTEAIRHKKDSSLVVGLSKIKENAGQVFITAGSTGALLVGTLLVAGRIQGVIRPALAPIVPSLAGGTMIIDAGMNTLCRPINYVQFAVMGSVFMEQMFHKESPRVGLINVGTEEEKGNETLKETLKLLKKCGVNFVGNIEGRDIAEGVVDVAVCDGFTGNAMLKMMEGTGNFFMHHMKRIFNSDLFTKISALLVKAHLKKLKDSVDPEEIGGTPILGAKGLIYKCHGNSKAKAIQNTILNASTMTNSVYIDQIRDRLATLEVRMNA